MDPTTSTASRSAARDLGLLDARGSERKVVTGGEADGSKREPRGRLRGTSVCDGCTGPWCEPRGWQGGAHDKIRIMLGTEADQDPLHTKYLQRRQRERVSEELAT